MAARIACVILHELGMSGQSVTGVKNGQIVHGRPPSHKRTVLVHVVLVARSRGSVRSTGCTEQSKLRQGAWPLYAATDY